MKLNELALEYRRSGRLCRERANLLRQSLPEMPECGGETMALRRRISMLESMAKDCWATSKYLENYYRRNEDDGKRPEMETIRERNRGEELEALRKAIRQAGRKRRLPDSRGA